MIKLKTTFIVILQILFLLLINEVGYFIVKTFQLPIPGNILGTILLLFKLSYDDYTIAKDIMTFLLGPATVALAVPLYKNREMIVKHSVPALLGILIGTISTMVSTVFLAKLLHLTDVVIASSSVKSATVPVAVEVANIIGGDRALTAAFVVATGILGTAIGPWLMNLTKITHPLSRGLSYGTISHGQGTAHAATEGELQGAIAGIAMGLAAVCTALLAPIIIPLFI